LTVILNVFLFFFRMPQIRDELDRSINDTRELLSGLPPPPTSDPRSEILTLLHKFSQDLAQQIEGVPDGIHDADEQGLIQAIRPVQEKFKRAIRATAPNFSPLEKSVSAKNWERPDFAPSLLVWEEGAENTAVTKAPPIFVDEVLERARRYASYSAMTCKCLSSLFVQDAYSRATWALPLHGAEVFHTEFCKAVVCALGSSLSKRPRYHVEACKTTRSEASSILWAGQARAASPVNTTRIYTLTIY
jgi:hypothetical protein